MLKGNSNHNSMCSLFFNVNRNLIKKKQICEKIKKMRRNQFRYGFLILELESQNAKETAMSFIVLNNFHKHESCISLQ